MKTLRRQCFTHEGQSTLEFTFAMIATALLIIGLLRVFVWTGRDLAARRQAHEGILTTQFGSHTQDVLKQLRPTFFLSTDIGAPVSSNIYGGN